MEPKETKQVSKECRFYENEMPEENDHVIIQISRVDQYAVFVQLLEYDNIEGMIILAEYSRTKKSRYNQGLLQARRNINKKDVCLVLRVDKDKKNIDLTKRKINPTNAKEAELRYQKSKKVQNLFYPLCDKFQKPMLYFHQKIVWPLQKNGNHAADVLERAIFKFDKFIGPLNLDNDIKLAFEEELKKKFTPKPLKLKAVFKMTCYSLKGIEDIQLALKEGQRAETDDFKLQIQIIAAPKYWIQTTTINFVEGEKILNAGLKYIQDYILKHEGTFEILEAPTDQETDDQIENLLTNNNNQQQKMEEDNSEGIQVECDEEIEDN